MAFEYEPKLTERKFDEYMASYHKLIQDRRVGKLSIEDYVGEKTQLNRTFFSEIANLDMRLFPHVEGLREFLLQIRPKDEVEDMISHELEHGNEAISLGYSVQYGSWLMQGRSGSLVLAPFTKVNEESNAPDLDRIKQAATHQSTYDKL